MKFIGYLFLSALWLVSIVYAGVWAQPLVGTVPVGNSLANITNTTTSLPATSTTVTLAAQSYTVTISIPSDADDAYVDFTGGAATTSDFRIPKGSSFTFAGLPGVSTFKIIGATATGNYSVFAH